MQQVDVFVQNCRTSALSSSAEVRVRSKRKRPSPSNLFSVLQYFPPSLPHSLTQGSVRSTPMTPAGSARQPQLEHLRLSLSHENAPRGTTSSPFPTYSAFNGAATLPFHTNQERSATTITRTHSVCSIEGSTETNYTRPLFFLNTQTNVITSITHTHTHFFSLFLIDLVQFSSALSLRIPCAIRKVSKK